MVDYLSSAPKEAGGVGAGAGVGASNGSSPPDAHHLRSLVGRTRGLLKSRLRSVLAGSNDLISGISTRLESALSLSTDTLSDSSATTTGGEERKDAGGDADDSTRATSTDDAAPTSRAAAAAEVFSKKLRLPQLGHALSFEDYAVLARHKKRKERAQAQAAATAAAARGGSSGDRDAASDRTTPTTPASPPHLHAAPNGTPAPVARSVSSGDSGGKKNTLAPLAPHELKATGPDPYEKLHYRTEAPSSGSASDLDGYGPSTSFDSDQDGKKYWVRSGSEGSVQSWASSLSYESQSDEKTAEAVEFMRKFVSDLFKDSSTIPLDQKSKFGQLAQHEAGRLWFARFVNAQRVHHKKVDESTFYSLVQYFAIVLFECADADDFSPAKSLMNMCFTFYHEVDVPGCEPYKEYLYTYLREQTIWHSLRFWNAAFFDALQCERVHRPVVTRDDIQSNSLEAITDEKQYQENITFGQLGTFTYNMHAFGLSKELCSEFLRKQCVIANLSEDQEKILRDNVERMYRETDPWR